MRAYVLTCDRYDFLLKGFAHQFNRHWPALQQVKVLCFREIEGLPANFSCELMAPEETLPWSDHLRKHLRAEAPERFLLMLDDYWLRKPVNDQSMHLARREMKKGADKFDLSVSTFRQRHQRHPDTRSLVIADRAARYRLSTQAAIWRRDYLLKHLVHGLNPWKFETQPTGMDGGRIVGPTRPYCVYANIYHKGKPSRKALAQLSERDRTDLQKIGALEHMPVLRRKKHAAAG